MSGERRLRVMVIDDEPPAVERLAGMLARSPGVEVVACESDPVRGLQRAGQLRPDVIFLDIRMPGLSGLGVASRLASLNPQPKVVFVTAYEQYAVEAFGLAAVDYLLKPVRGERLAEALRRCCSTAGAESEWIVAQIGERRLRIPLDEVRAFVARDKCTLVYAPDTMALVPDTLKHLEQRYPDRFVRIHRNALVSRRHLRELASDSDGTERVRVDGLDLRLEVSRRNRAQVREVLDAS
ncbi:MAG: LytTR family DNA-binding domain-containing protein [Wenzhouxiangellaceae bacterium]